MFPPFKPKETLARNVSVDLDDTLAAKEALRYLRYYEVPSYGMTRYTDEPLFKAIENFQKDHKLKVDSTINPSGETQTMINHALMRKDVSGLHRGSRGGKVNSPELYGMFDKFSSQPFHATGSAYSTQCCATGTIDCEKD